MRACVVHCILADILQHTIKLRHNSKKKSLVSTFGLHTVCRCLRSAYLHILAVAFTRCSAEALRWQYLQAEAVQLVVDES
jgi:hypothetical protein